MLLAHWLISDSLGSHSDCSSSTVALLKHCTETFSYTSRSDSRVSFSDPDERTLKRPLPPLHTNTEWAQGDRRVNPSSPPLSQGCGERKNILWISGNLSQFHCSVDVSSYLRERRRGAARRVREQMQIQLARAPGNARAETLTAGWWENQRSQDLHRPRRIISVTACEKSKVIMELPRTRVLVKSTVIYTRAAFCCFLPCCVVLFTCERLIVLIFRGGFHTLSYFLPRLFSNVFHVMFITTCCLCWLFRR